MRVRSLHDWHLTPAEAIALQKKLALSIVQGPPLDTEPVALVCGVDVSSSKYSDVLTAGAVVWDANTSTVIEAVWAQAKSPFPYIPGLLSFREIPVLIQAIEKLQSVPQAFLVDGQGIAHPRRLGIASHLGLLIDCPTVGVGKSRLCGVPAEPGPKKGDSAPLIDRDELIGSILRSKDTTNPLYVSVGNHIDLESAVTLVMYCDRGYRLPEPTRLAHIHVNLVRTTGKGLAESEPTLL